MQLSGAARVALRLVTAVVLAFVYLPLLVVVVNSFNPDRVADWPPDGFTVGWWARALDNPGARAAPQRARQRPQRTLRAQRPSP